MSKKRAIDELREQEAEKIKDIFLKMYDICMTAKSDRDRINAGKVCASLLGTPRTQAEKPVAPPLVKADKATEVFQVPADIEERIKRVLAGQ